MTSTDRIRVTTVVPAEPALAFDRFTREVDAWWKQGPRYRPAIGTGGVMRFEPGVGGRLLESYDDGRDPFVLGRVLAWEPHARLVVEWRARNFDPEQVTEVEVTFAPAPGGTRVTVEHRGWDAIPPDHPARHGLAGVAFSGMIGLYWADLLTTLRSRARSR